MTKEPEQLQPEQILHWCKNNAQAAKFVLDIGDIMHLWDDLIDKDKVPTDGHINDRFYKALITIPRNSFYQDNFAQLNTLLEQAIISWLAATAVERRPDREEHEEIAAFITRSDYVNLLLACAAITGGVGWAVHIAPEVRRMVHDEGLAGYREALRLEVAARGA